MLFRDGFSASSAIEIASSAQKFCIFLPSDHAIHVISHSHKLKKNKQYIPEILHGIFEILCRV